jgi:hypothetical protein
MAKKDDRVYHNLPKIPDWQKKVIVFGTRTFDDYKLLRSKLDHYCQNFLSVAVVTGAAKGADALGERWAYENKLLVVRFHPDWDRHGKKAGPMRNREMAGFVGKKGFAVGFWDGRSPGTKDMISVCKEFGIKLKVVKY